MPEKVTAKEERYRKHIQWHVLQSKWSVIVEYRHSYAHDDDAAGNACDGDDGDGGGDGDGDGGDGGDGDGDGDGGDDW